MIPFHAYIISYHSNHLKGHYTVSTHSSSSNFMLSSSPSEIFSYFPLLFWLYFLCSSQSSLITAALISFLLSTLYHFSYSAPQSNFFFQVTFIPSLKLTILVHLSTPMLLAPNMVLISSPVHCICLELECNLLKASTLPFYKFIRHYVHVCIKNIKTVAPPYYDYWFKLGPSSIPLLIYAIPGFGFVKPTIEYGQYNVSLCNGI